MNYLFHELKIIQSFVHFHLILVLIDMLFNSRIIFSLNQTKNSQGTALLDALKKTKKMINFVLPF
jgi:hypothetical protein